MQRRLTIVVVSSVQISASGYQYGNDGRIVIPRDPVQRSKAIYITSLEICACLQQRGDRLGGLAAPAAIRVARME